MDIQTLLDDESFINAVADLVMAELDRRRGAQDAARPLRMSLISAQFESIREAGRLCSQLPYPVQHWTPSQPPYGEAGPKA